jgi:cell division protein FtsZ
MQLGVQVTKGLGAGSHPDIGKSSADETKHEIMERLEGTNMLFITAGMGGGTGTGAAPVIARVAKELGILTVAVVTKPFQFEGAGRMRIAEQGLKELEHLVDTTIVIPNQNLFKVADEKTTFADAFSMADDVLHAGVRSITDLMVVPGLINLDFADVKTIMNNMGRAMMGTGEASGENRAIECAHNAVTNPLLDDYSLDGAKGLLINITGGTDLTLHEVDKITNEIREQVHPDADVIVGSIFDDKLEGKARVSVVATGLDSHPKPTKSIVDLHITRNSAVSSIAATPAVNSNSIQASLSNEETNEELTENSDPYMFMNGENSDIHSETVIEDTEVMMEPEMAAEEEVESITEPEISEPEMAAEEEVESITEPEISEPEMAAEEEVESEPITEPEMVTEDVAPNSIMDLINVNRENNELDSPDLFSGQNIHQLDDINDTKDEEIIEESETDQDLLEIPSFLRRQSK